MNIQINEKQTGNLMTDLNIPQDRCKELCNVIEKSIHELHEQNQGRLTQAMILQQATKHARNDNERAFVIAQCGEYWNEYQNWITQQALGGLNELFGNVQKRAFEATGSARRN